MTESGYHFKDAIHKLYNIDFEAEPLFRGVKSLRHYIAENDGNEELSEFISLVTGDLDELERRVHDAYEIYNIIKQMFLDCTGAHIF